MKLFVVTLFVGIATAAQLSNNYLPPTSAGSAGGHGGFLQGPNTRTSFNTAGQPSSFSHGAGALGGGAHAGPTGGGSGAYGGQGGFGGSGAAGGFGGGSAGGGFGGQQHGGSSGQQIPILRYENINNGDGSYHFDYATGNGINHNEEGHLNNPGSDQAEQVVQGSYSYTGDDGQTFTVHYKADANGFQPVGDHLPTPPPIPEAILRSLEYNAAHPEENDAGQYNAAAHGGGSASYGGGAAHGGGSASYGGGAAHGGRGGFGGGFGGGGASGSAGHAGHAGSFGGAAGSHGSTGHGGAGTFGHAGASHIGGFGGTAQQQYLPPQQHHQSGGAGGAAGYQY